VSIEENKMEDKVKSTAKSATGSLFYFLFSAICVAFLAGVPLGMAAHEFSNTMFSPDITSSPR
jgi:uncharacterized membrane protein YccF (DUF307 family)